MAATYFVTGALGCIGAWVVKTIAERGDVPVVFDLGDDPRRIQDIVDEDTFSRIRFVAGDLTRLDDVARAIGDHGATRIVHLAGLQVPFCKADPPRGAMVNVVGTLHVFEAAKRLGLRHVVYASSAAVYGLIDDGPPDESATCEPGTHYGVFKRANEGNARVYWSDDGIGSIGLRPLTVYGVGRDQGLTSGPTSAMKAAALGRPYTIRFTGPTDFHYVADTAAAFVGAADAAPDGAHVFNLHGETVTVAQIIDLIDRCGEPEKQGLVRADGPVIPIAPELDGSAIHKALPFLPSTPLEEGIRETMQRFRDLAAAGRLDTRDLD